MRYVLPEPYTGCKNASPRFIPASEAFGMTSSIRYDFSSSTTTENGGNFTFKELPFKLAPLKLAGLILFGLSKVLWSCRLLEERIRPETDLNLASLISNVTSWSFLESIFTSDTCTNPFLSREAEAETAGSLALPTV